MGSSSGGAMGNNTMAELAELFAPRGRRPLLSNALRTVYEICSHFPDEYPLAPFPDYIRSHTSGVWQAISNDPRKSRLRPTSDGGRNDHAPRGERGSCIILDGHGSVEVRSLPTDNEQSNVRPNEVLCRDSGVNGSRNTVDDGGKETETVDRVACNEGTNNRISEVQNVTQGLLGIERILMDESDDLGLSQMSDKDVNFDILKDFGSFAGTNGLGDDSVPVESIGNDKLPVQGTVNRNVLVENKGNDVEAKNSTSGGSTGQFHAQVPTERQKSGSSEIGNLVVGASPRVAVKEAQVNGGEAYLNLSEIADLNFSAQGSKNDGGTMMGAKAVDSIEKGRKSAVDKGKSKKSKKEEQNVVDSAEKGDKSAVDKGKTRKSKKEAEKVVDSIDKGRRPRALDKGKTNKDEKAAQKDGDAIEKGHKSLAVDKGETKKRKKADPVDVKSGKHMHLSWDSEISKIVQAEGADTVANEQMPEENVQVNKENLSSKLVDKSGSTKCEKLQYTREQLMNLRQSGAVPEDVFKAVTEISAQLHGVEKSPTSEEAKNGSVCGKGKLNTSTEYNNAEEMVSSILKKKKRGSSSEARKEKKKQKRRKKRAELNKKLGVKRLKLKPIMKPKVMPHCRHYLKGRCHEGEKCKFSHDVIPLTKSKPCCHFARSTCLKGDDCPFDHQLSNYPCNNIVETGYCSRGDSCLFSHEIPAKETSETTEGVSKRQTTSLNPHGMSKSMQQVVPNVSTPGIATTKNLKENLTTHINRPAKALKSISKPDVNIVGTTGRSNLTESLSSSDNTLTSIPGSAAPQRVGFLPPERFSVHSSGTKNQAGVDSAGIFGQTYLTASAGAFDLHKNFMSLPPPTPQVSFAPLEMNSVDRVVTKSRANASVAGTGVQPNQTVQAKYFDFCKNYMNLPPFPTPQVSSPLLEMNSVNRVVTKNRANFNVAGTVVQPNLTVQAKDAQLSKTSVGSSGNKNQVNSLTCGDSSGCPSFGKPLLHEESSDKGWVDSAHQLNKGRSSRLLDASDHKLQGQSTDQPSVSQTGNVSVSESDKLKAVHSKVQISPTSGQCSIRTASPVKITPDKAKRAILSTLAFAARYESKIKMNSAAANEVKKSDGASTSECKQKNEPIKALDILEWLYGGSCKEKQ